MQHASDYLKSFADNQEHWLKVLIYEALNTNGTIAQERIDAIIKHLTEGSALDTPTLTSSSPQNNSQVKWKELKHVSGVNALAEGEEIKFSPHVTILYGGNGAGKSSYFKIMNELAGGNQQKQLLSNIYVDDTQEIKVKISYATGNEHAPTFEWNNEKRGISPLTQSKVFDTSYKEGLLSQRTTDETVVQPLGLHLFGYISEQMDQIKKGIKYQVKALLQNKPQILLDKLQESQQKIFNEKTYISSQKAEIEALYDFPEEKVQELSEVSVKISELNKANENDRIKIIQGQKQAMQGLHTFLNGRYQYLMKSYQHAQERLKTYKHWKQKNEQARDQVAILKNIPGSNTDEWKQFIKAGYAYQPHVPNSENHCIYCGQPLTDDALTRVQAYTEYLNDETEAKLKEAIQDIKKHRENLQKYHVSYDISDTLKEQLEQVALPDGTKLDEVIIKTIEIFAAFKESLLEALNEKENLSEALNTIQPMLDILNKEMEARDKQIEELHKRQSERDTRLKEANEQLEKLQAHQSIHEQAGKIKHWFELDQQGKRLEKIADKINTRSLTRLSTSAHQELLTDRLRQLFGEELHKLGYSLTLEIKKTGGQKGSFINELMLQNQRDVKKILSEGEQKAVALSLFIAEARLQGTKHPVILDDPVNSMDHRIAGKFAERLLGLDNQIIIFNHNRLFLDAFESSQENHICKDLHSCQNHKGKHIKIYQVQSQNQFKKGLLSNYKQNNAKRYLKELKRVINRRPFEDDEKAAVLTRKAVESLIDEVVFNNQIPLRYSNKNSRVNWDNLKKLNADNQLLDEMKSIHSRVSGGEIHIGTESEENKIDLEEYDQIHQKLQSILSNRGLTTE